MKTIIPLAITDVIISSTILTDQYPTTEWVSTTTYGLNNIVYITGQSLLRTAYKSLQSGNLNHNPLNAFTWWIRIGDVYPKHGIATSYNIGDIVQGVGGVMTSPEGIGWTLRTSAADNYWTAIAWNGRVFAAVAQSGTGNRVMTSPDGITWTIRTSAADNSWTGIAWNGTVFAAVAASGTGNRVMTSPDGITWTIRTSAADNDWTAIAWNGTVFAAVAWTGTGNRVMTSPDGITWTIRTTPADNIWTAIAWNGTVFAAVAINGTGNRVMTSPDGITWTIRTSAADNNWQAIAWNGTVFVAVATSGTGNRVMTSPDGITWTSRTSAADNDWTAIAWNGTVFAAVSLSHSGSHEIFESQVSANLGNSLTDNTKWIKLGPSNYMAMFDTLRTTKSTGGSPFEFSLTPGARIDSIGMAGLVANSIHLVITSGGSTVYDETIDLNSREILDWYDYFFEEFSTIPGIARFYLPPYTDAVITITITSVSNLVEIGAVIIGSKVDLGEAQLGAMNDGLNFSTITRDFEGNINTLIQRRSIPKTNQITFFDKKLTNKIRKSREVLNAVPTIWSGLDDAETNDYFESFLLLGIYRTFSINAEHPDHGIVQIEVEEL